VATTEEAALRHVALLVARGAPAPEIFAAVAEQVAGMLGLPWACVMRYDSDDSFVVLASWGEHPFPVGSRRPLDGPNMFEPAAPIIVEGATWGVIAVPAIPGAPIPEEAETRLSVFTELVATAISNEAAGDELARLAEEQAALRRLAALVAQHPSPEDVFAAVAEAVGSLLGADVSAMVAFPDEIAGVVVASWGRDGSTVPVGTALPLDNDSAVARIFQSAAAARIDDYEDGAGAEIARTLGVRSSVGAPIFVGGKLWGALAAAMRGGDPLPVDAEARIAAFTELVATAVSNAQAHSDLQRLVDEQAALRRVATLVAREPSPEEVFVALTDEARRILGSEAAGLLRFEPDGTAALVAQSETPWDPPPLGTRFTLDGENFVTHVFHTGQAARVDDWTDSTGAVSAMATVLGVRSAVGSPVVVEGRLWGVIVAATSRDEPLPAETESRLAQFTELIATAVSNAEARDGLARLAAEQAALRRVAVLVARGAGPEGVFGAVAAEVGLLFGADVSAIVRFEEDGTATVLGDVGGPHVSGKRVSLDEGYVVHSVRETRRSARFDTHDPSAAGMPSLVRALGIRSSVASPIVVEGNLWGAITAASVGDPLPSSAERRLTEFTELVATAVANTEAGEHVVALAEEQAALRRVATLVAEDAPPAELFRAVAVEVGRLLGAEFSGLARFADGAVVPIATWGSEEEHPQLPERWPLQPGDPATMIAEGQGSVRVDDWSEMPGPIAAFIRDELGVRSTIVTPIVVEGRVWGCVAAHSRQPLPPQSESRLSQFGDLVATAVGNAEARAEVTRLASEQAALRRIATLVAGGAEPERVFAAVTGETAAAFDAVAAVLRFEHDPPAYVVVGISHETGTAIGTRQLLAEGLASTEVYRTRRPTRRGAADWTTHAGSAAEALLWPGVTSAVACPIIVEGRLWGVVTLNADRELPHDSEQRLEDFTELVTTAIANAEAGIAVRAAADEQGALRRVATLVAASAAPADLFVAVTNEIALVLGADAAMLCRADPDGAAVVVGTWTDGTPEPAHGTRIPRGGRNLTTIVLETGRAARIDSYGETETTGYASEFARTYGLRSAVGAPIHVEGRLWGLVVAGTTRDEPLPSDAEERLTGFTELVATAISNAQAQEDLRSLAAQQAALRRVATLVARRVAPDVIFRVVAEEAGGLLGADVAGLVRYESDDTVTVMAGPPPGPFATGQRVALDPSFVVYGVRETGRPARFETDDPAGDEMPELVRRFGIRSGVASPIVVEGARWGAIVLASRGASFPSGTEQRLDDFTELVATAISNATARAELVASRARIVAAGDEARRRIERNLHDGTQQRLIALGLDLQRARAEIPDGQRDTHSALAGAEQDLEAILLDLRELSHGLHPPLLSRLGLGPSLQALVRGSPIPVQLDVDLAERPAASLETAVYYVVSEALTNAIKHSHASEVSVTITSAEKLEASIVDDGVGDADPSGGSGLTGLLDRVDALGGRFTLDSPPRGGTRISIELPIEPTVASS
jgi:GAF domain-containing protein